jgi:hypothetical protein
MGPRTQYKEVRSTMTEGVLKLCSNHENLFFSTQYQRVFVVCFTLLPVCFRILTSRFCLNLMEQWKKIWFINSCMTKLLMRTADLFRSHLSNSSI